MNSERGSVLIIVVWALAIIGVIATFMMYQTQAEWASALSFEQRVKFREAVKDALHERLAILAEDDTEYDCAADPWYGKTGEIRSEKNGYQIIVKIEDEGSKPNLNFIANARNIAPIKYLLDPVGTNTGPSIDPICEWWDMDNDGEFETSYYQSQDPSYKPRNGFYSSLEELKMLKNGDKIYDMIARDVTIYGKINPNIISSEIFANLLNSVGGFEKSWIEMVRGEFDQFRGGGRGAQPFMQIDDFLKLSHVTLLTLERLKPLFRFDGSCNINLVTKTQFNTILKYKSIDAPQTFDQIKKKREEGPYKSIDELNGLFTSIQLSDYKYYFSVSSTIIRYRIWVTKGQQKYYLDTVQERVRKGLKKEWKVYPLYWRELMNQEVPEPPMAKKTETNAKVTGEN